MMILTSHKPGGIVFNNDFIKLFIIRRNMTVLFYIVVNEGFFLYFVNEGFLYFLNMMILTKSHGIIFNNDFIKLFIISSL